MKIAMLDGRLPRMANILFFQPEVVDGWRLQRQGRRWFLGIIIAHLPEILLLRIIGYLENIFPRIQVDRVATALNTAADED